MNQPINYEDKKLTIKQWSVQDRPREKYAKNGALALSDAELIAILLRTGNPNDSAVELAKKLLAQSGNSLSRLSGKTLRELSDVKGIGQAKAISLLSAFELGKRMRAEKVEECLQIRSSTDVVNLMQDKIADLEHEEFWAIYLNQANRILNTVQISRGGISSTPVDTRIVLQQAVLNKATQFVLCHNHPLPQPPVGIGQAESQRHPADRASAAGRRSDGSRAGGPSHHPSRRLLQLR